MSEGNEKLLLRAFNEYISQLANEHISWLAEMLFNYDETSTPAQNVFEQTTRTLAKPASLTIETLLDMRRKFLNARTIWYIDTEEIEVGKFLQMPVLKEVDGRLPRIVLIHPDDICSLQKVVKEHNAELGNPPLFLKHFREWRS